MESSLINKKIIINNSIVFTPSERLLKNIHTSDSVVLFTPACYCLQHLLSNPQKLHHKAELIECAWKGAGQTISDNAYYQMVFNLRHSLEAVGGNDVVVTVPRRGLQIRPAIPIQVSDSNHLEKIDSNDHFKWSVLKSSIIDFKKIFYGMFAIFFYC